MMLSITSGAPAGSETLSPTLRPDSLTHRRRVRDGLVLGVGVTLGKHERVSVPVQISDSHNRPGYHPVLGRTPRGEPVPVGDVLAAADRQIPLPRLYLPKPTVVSLVVHQQVAAISTLVQPGVEFLLLLGEFFGGHPILIEFAIKRRFTIGRRGDQLI